MPLIELQNLSKTYNTTAVPVQAVKNVNLKIEKQEFTAIVGPSVRFGQDDPVKSDWGAGQAHKRQSHCRWYGYIDSEKQQVG